MKQWRRFLAAVLIVSVTFTATNLPSIVSNATAEENTYFFFDERIVDEQNTSNVSLKVNEIDGAATQNYWLDPHEWSEANEGDIPIWENKVTIMYPNVLYDPEGISVDGVSKAPYKMWYIAVNNTSPTTGISWVNNIIDKGNSRGVSLDDVGTQPDGTPEGTWYPGGNILCYMESQDGKTWTRPGCGQFYYKNSDGTVVDTNIVYIGNHGCSAIKNDHPQAGKTEPMFLLAGQATGTGYEGGIAISWSDDGISWREPIVIKTYTEGGLYMKADTHNQLHWSDALGQYVVISRGLPDNTEPDESKRWIRTVLQMTSKNITSLKDMATIKDKAVAAGNSTYWTETTNYWTDPKLVLEGTSDAQPYSMPNMEYENGYYIGVVSVADFANGTEGQLSYGKVHAELVWSPDMEHWYYMDRGTPFIDNAEEFAFEKGNDYGMIYCAAPVDNGTGMRVYYAATPELHYMSYAQIPKELKENVDDKYPLAAENESITRTTTLNVADFGYDSFAGYQVAEGAEKGIVKTDEFTVTGTTIRIGASSTENIAISAIDETGTVLATGSLNASDTDARGRYAVNWSADIATDTVVTFAIDISGTTQVYSISGNIEAVDMTIKDVDDAIFFEDFDGAIEGDNTNQWMVRDETDNWDSYDGSYTYVDLESGNSYKGTGSVALKKSGKQVLVRKTFDEAYNKVLSLWFYDDATVEEARVMAGVEGGNSSLSGRLALGVRKSTSTENYTLWMNASSYADTGVARETGWHQFVFDFRDTTNAYVYIDGELIKQVSHSESNIQSPNQFKQITLGWWDAATSTAFAIDHLKITDTLPWENTIDGVTDFTASVKEIEIADQNRDGMYELKDTIVVSEFTKSFDAAYEGGGGFSVTTEEASKLVPGSVIEIQYDCEVDQLWLGNKTLWFGGNCKTEVVGDDTDTYRKIGFPSTTDTTTVLPGELKWNDSGTIVQITYEQLNECLADGWSDVGGWIGYMSGGPCTIESVIIGARVTDETGEDRTNLYTLANVVEIESFTESIVIQNEGDWGQGSFTISQEMEKLLVPDSVIEVCFASQKDANWDKARLLWFAGSDSNGDWKIIGVTSEAGGVGTVIYNESETIVQITYEMLQEHLGDGWNDAGKNLYYQSGSNCTIQNIRIGQALSADGTNIELTWTNPSVIEPWDEIIVVRSEEEYPKSVKDGEIIYRGTGTSSLDVIADPEEIVYYYAAFAYYEMIYSEPAYAIVDLSVKSAELSDSNIRYCKAGKTDLTTSITWNDATVISDVQTIETSIGSDNYSVTDSMLTITKEYLDTLEIGTYEFTVIFDRGSTATLRIQIIDAYGQLSEDFEYGLDKNVWTRIKDGDSWVTASSGYEGLSYASLYKTENAHSGDYVFRNAKESGGSALLEMDYGSSVKYQKVVSVWFYDDGVSKETEAYVKVLSGAKPYVGIGLRNETSSDEYTYLYSTNNYKASGVKRSEGWHQFVVDFTKGYPVLYIDGQVVAELSETPDGSDSFPMSSFNKVWIGWFQTQSSGNCYFDDASISNAIDYYNVETYRNGEVYTYPTKAGKVFAGWYTDEACKIALGEGVKTGFAYAKWVDENVLSVRCQLPASVSTDMDTVNLRMVTSVDSLDYKTVAFHIKVGEVKTINKVTNTVYTTITANESTGMKEYIPEEVFKTAGSKYFIAYTLSEIPSSVFGETVTITPKWTTLDGTTVTGVQKQFTLTEKISAFSNSSL